VRTPLAHSYLETNQRFPLQRKQNKSQSKVHPTIANLDSLIPNANMLVVDKENLVIARCVP